MDILKNVKNRPAAKAMSDIILSDSSWKPDFDIADRYQNFANELMRISLLGIAGYGYLIKEVYMKNSETFEKIKHIADPLWIGLIALGLALAFVLMHRFLSTSCLYYQVLIMRSLTRLENPHWTENEKENEKIFLTEVRDAQRIKSTTSHYILALASIFFAIGFLFVIFVFYKCYSNFPALPRT